MDLRGDSLLGFFKLRSPRRILERMWLLALPVIVLGCQGQPEEAEVLVKAWGRALIATEDFNSRLRREAPDCAETSEQSCLALKRDLLKQMIDEAILQQRAKEQGVEVSQAELVEAEHALLAEYEGAEDLLEQAGYDRERWRSAFREQIEIYRLLGKALPEVRVEYEEILSYFRDHREAFLRPRERRVRQIVLARGEEAFEIRQRLKKGEDFASLAEEYSLSPEAKEGGDLGFLRPGQMPPELEDVVFSLEVGKFSEVISSDYGFHILRVEEDREPRELEVSEVEGEIRRILLRQKTQRAYRAWLDQQWKDAQVEILNSHLGPPSGKSGRVS